MVRQAVAAAFALLLSAEALLAQQPAAPIPLYPGAAPRPFEPEPLPPVAPAAEPAGPAAPDTPPPAEPAAAPAPADRVFCEQPVAIRLADRDAVPARYRPFVGIWSDASWTPQLCAALIVENVTPDGTASIVYVFGPMGSAAGRPGGILRGTGIVRDGALLFQNSDGSQFSFRPRYADLDGSLTTPQGERYEAVFKKAP